MDTGSLVIRAARKQDAATLAAIEMQTAPEFAQYLLEGLFDCSPGAALASIYARGGVDSWEWSWIAELEGAQVGAIGAYPVALVKRGSDTGEAARRLAKFAPIREAMLSDAFHISRLGVLNGFRRLGIARQLIDAACRVAGAYGETRVTLFVWEDNAPAIRLYEALGFSELARVMIEPDERLLRAGVSLMLGRAL